MTAGILALGLIEPAQAQQQCSSNGFVLVRDSNGFLTESNIPCGSTGGAQPATPFARFPGNTFYPPPIIPGIIGTAENDPTGPQIGAGWQVMNAISGGPPLQQLGVEPRRSAVSTIAPPRFSITGGVSGERVNGDGLRIRDAAGAFAGIDARTPAFTGRQGGGWLHGELELGPTFGFAENQSFSLDAGFGAQSARLSYEAPFGVAAVGRSSTLDRTGVGLNGGFHYTHDGFYARGRAGLTWSDNDLSTTSVGAGTFARASYDGHGGFADLRLGHVFTLFNALTASPASTSVGSLQAVLLDLGGRLGYEWQRDDGFVDSLGFAFGDQRYRSGVAGARARLGALFLERQTTILPYLGLTLDELFDVHHNLVIPAQGAAAADILSFDHARTFWGAEAGVALGNPHAVSVELSAFYKQSSDLEAAGGRAALSIRF